MINLRYHIVSLTAVFLAIGIGLTLGSTFLDRATVENLRGQLENLEGRLAERDLRIQDLEAQLSDSSALQAALDEEGAGLLAGLLPDVPVVVVTSRGVDESDIDESVEALRGAGADVQGIWWLTDRWSLDDDSEVDDLATALEAGTTDPSRLRRMAIDTLGGELRSRQLLATDPAEPGTGEAGTGEGTSGEGGAGGAEPGSTTSEAEGPDGGVEGPEVPEEAIDVLSALTDIGFVDFEQVPEGPDAPRFPDGTRIVFAGGSPDVPDDLVIEPLVQRMGSDSSVPILGVASSAMPDDGRISDLVEVVRQDEDLREILPTVDDLEHFEGWAAMVIALGDVADGVVGHYGLAEDATRLLPPITAP